MAVTSSGVKHPSFILQICIVEVLPASCRCLINKNALDVANNLKQTGISCSDMGITSLSIISYTQCYYIQKTAWVMHVYSVFPSACHSITFFCVGESLSWSVLPSPWRGSVKMTLRVFLVLLFNL